MGIGELRTFAEDGMPTPALQTLLDETGQDAATVQCDRRSCRGRLLFSNAPYKMRDRTVASSISIQLTIKPITGVAKSEQLLMPTRVTNLFPRSLLGVNSWAIAPKLPNAFRSGDLQHRLSQHHVTLTALKAINSCMRWQNRFTQLLMSRGLAYRPKLKAPIIELQRVLEISWAFVPSQLSQCI
jgi:hypothetical protein